MKDRLAKPLVFSLVVIFASFFWGLSSPAKNERQKPASSNFSSLPLPTATPSPSPAPTTTPELLTGFCLKVPILLYHHIEPADLAEKNGHSKIAVFPDFFEKQISYLAEKGYTSLSLDQIVQALINRQDLPAQSLAVTFDDAYEDFYTFAWPVLQKYNFHGNLMIPTGLVENPGYLSWNKIKEMVNSGLVHPYPHGWSHTSLVSVAEEKIESEISLSKKQIEENTGKTTSVFAYPYGLGNSVIINTLQANGFLAAVSTIPGFYQCDSFLMNLRRNRIGNSLLSSYGL